MIWGITHLLIATVLAVTVVSPFLSVWKTGMTEYHQILLNWDTQTLNDSDGSVVHYIRFCSCDGTKLDISVDQHRHVTRCSTDFHLLAFADLFSAGHHSAVLSGRCLPPSLGHNSFPLYIIGPMRRCFCG